MGNYENDYTDDAYDRYMLTGESAGYFEQDTHLYAEDAEPQTNIEYKDLNTQLDDVIRFLKAQIKEKERIIKSQKKKSLKKTHSSLKVKKKNN